MKYLVAIKNSKKKQFKKNKQRSLKKRKRKKVPELSIVYTADVGFIWILFVY